MHCCVQVVDANKDARAKAAAEADVLLTEEQLAFEAWRDSLETVPTIKVIFPMSNPWPPLHPFLVTPRLSPARIAHFFGHGGGVS